MTRTLRLLALVCATALGGAPLAAQGVGAPPPLSQARGWIGISYETTLAREGARLREVSRVVDVREGSPAARAGIRPGDILVSFNGIRWEEHFERGAPGLRPGDALRLVVERDGRRRELRLVAGTRPSEHPQADARSVAVMPDSVVERLFLAMDSLRQRIVQEGALVGRIAELQAAADSVMEALTRGRALRPRLPGPGQTAAGAPSSAAAEMQGPGLPAPYVLGQNRAAGAEVLELRPELAAYFQVEGGILVVDVAPGTPAALAGVLPGDVLSRLGGEPLRSIADLRRALSRAPHDATLTLVRKGRTLEVQLRR